MSNKVDISLCSNLPDRELDDATYTALIVAVLNETATVVSNPDEFFLEFDVMNTFIQYIQGIITYRDKHENKMNLVFHQPYDLYEN